MPERYSTTDITKLLQTELESFVQPKVRDPESATSEDLIKDVHRMLVGNGGPTRGIMWKLAETRIDIRRLREDVIDVDSKIDDQVSYCKGVQRKLERVKFEDDVQRKLEESTRTRRRKTVTWLLNNKSFMTLAATIAMAVLGWTRGCVVVLDGTNDSSELVSRAAEDT